MNIAFAGILVTIFAALSLLHIYWALGGRVAVAAAVPSENGHAMFEPGPVACLAVALALGSAAAISAMRVGLIAMVFIVRAIGDFRFVGFFKRVRGSVFARRDTLIYSPLCVAISLLAAGVAVLSP